MKNNDVTVVVCGSIRTAIVPGSKTYKCDKCGQDCWASSDKSHELIANGGKPLCLDCAVGLIKFLKEKGQEPEIMDNKEQIEQVNKFLKGQELN